MEDPERVPAGLLADMKIEGHFSLEN